MTFALSRITLRSKLIAGFGVVLFITASLGVFATHRMASMHTATEAVTFNALPGVIGLEKLVEAMQDFRIAESSYVLSTDHVEMKSIEREMNKLVAYYDVIRKDYDAEIDPGEESERFERIDALRFSYMAMHRQMVDAAQQGETATSTRLFKVDMHYLFGSFRKLMGEDSDYNNATAQDGARHEREIYKSASQITYYVIAGAFLVTLMIGFGLVRGICGPLTAMTKAMLALSEKNMTTAIPGVGRRDEIGGMAGAVRIFKENMLTADRLTSEREAERATKEQRTARLEAGGPVATEPKLHFSSRRP